jgi:hypothetical protein
MIMPFPTHQTSVTGETCDKLIPLNPKGEMYTEFWVGITKGSSPQQQNVEHILSFYDILTNTFLPFTTFCPTPSFPLQHPAQHLPSLYNILPNTFLPFTTSYPTPSFPLHHTQLLSSLYNIPPNTFLPFTTSYICESVLSAVVAKRSEHYSIMNLDNYSRAAIIKPNLATMSYVERGNHINHTDPGMKLPLN